MLIGEVAKEYNVSIDTLRYYDRVGLVSPARRNGIRIYNRNDIKNLVTVVRLKRLMFSLEEISEILTADEKLDRAIENDTFDVSAAQAIYRQIKSKYDELEEMEENLKAAKKTIESILDKVRREISE